MYEVSLFFFRIYLTLFRARRVICKHDQIPSSGPLIVVANHVSDLDPWLVSDLFPLRRTVHWWAKCGLLSVKARTREYQNDNGYSLLLAWLMALGTVFVVRYSKTIPVDRENLQAAINRRAISRTVKILEAGGVVGIFGTGGQNQDNEAQPIFVKLARKHRVPIVPVKIEAKRIIVGKVIHPGQKYAWLPAEDHHQAAQAVMRYIDTLASA